MWMERSVFVCMWRDGRCVERGVFVGVFVEKQEVSGGRDRGVSECMWREWGVVVERMGCGCGELRYVEQAMGVCWGAGVERWGGRERD